MLQNAAQLVVACADAQVCHRLCNSLRGQCSWFGEGEESLVVVTDGVVHAFTYGTFTSAAVYAPSMATLAFNAQLGDYLGSGSFGSVHVATDKVTGQHYAVKTIRCALLSACSTRQPWMTQPGL